MSAVSGRDVLAHLTVALTEHLARQRRSGYAPPPELLAVADVLRDALSDRQAPSSCVCGRSGPDGEVMPAPVLLRIPEAAHVLAVSRSTVERLLASGELCSVRVGAGVRVRRDDLEAYIAGLPSRHTTAGRASAGGR